MFVLLLISSTANAESACEFKIYEVGLGYEESKAAEVLESQGFRRIDATTTFTNLPVWPPDGVELTAEEIQYASFLTDPVRAAALWKMAETDSELKTLLEDLPDKPETPHEVTITLGVAGASAGRGRARPSAAQSDSAATGVNSIFVKYFYAEDRWLGGNEPGVIVFSEKHEARDAELWARYCSNAGARDQQGADFSTEEQYWVCATHDPAGGTFVQITVQERAGDRCKYQYNSRGQSGDEMLR